MERDIQQQLVDWKSDSRRRPLILRGARQVGKSYVVSQFGKKYFKQVVMINFDLHPEYQECFDTRVPSEILKKLFFQIGVEVIPGECLLFIDEIQECPEAMMALRYFYELMPELHVIAAGSLLEFSIESDKYRAPVGRVQHLYLKPMSFGEYLDAIEYSHLREWIVSGAYWDDWNESIHHRLLLLLKEYVMLGGMPAVISEYIETGQFTKAFSLQSGIVETYEDDFSKYASKAKVIHLAKLLHQGVKLVGQKFKYVNIDSEVRSRELKDAFALLEKAGVVYRVKNISGASIPLEAVSNENYFKMLFLDVGLMQGLSGLDTSIMLKEDLAQINAGAIAEQLVGQELMAYSNPEVRSRSYYWASDVRGQQSEIDYLIQYEENIIPVEVKSGKAGTLKSLRRYQKQYHPRYSIKFSSAPPEQDQTLISIPLYAVESVPQVLTKLGR